MLSPPVSGTLLRQPQDTNITMLPILDTPGFQAPRCPHGRPPADVAPATASPAPSDRFILPLLGQWFPGALLSHPAPPPWPCLFLVPGHPSLPKPTTSSYGTKFTTPPNLQRSPWRTTGIGAIKACAEEKLPPNSCRWRGSLEHATWPRLSALRALPVPTGS